MSEIAHWVERARAYAAREEAGAQAARIEAARDRDAGRLHQANLLEHEAATLERAARMQRLIADELRQRRRDAEVRELNRRSLEPVDRGRSS